MIQIPSGPQGKAWERDGWQPLSSTSARVIVVNKIFKPTVAHGDCLVVSSRGLWSYSQILASSVKMKLHLFHFDIYLLRIVYFIIFCSCCCCFFDRPHGTELKIYQHFDCKTLMHVYNYVFIHGTNHASLKFLHTIEPKLQGMMQVPRLQCCQCGAMTQHIRLSVTL